MIKKYYKIETIYVFKAMREFLYAITLGTLGFMIGIISYIRIYKTEWVLLLENRCEMTAFDNNELLTYSIMLLVVLIISIMNVKLIKTMEKKHYVINT